MNLREKIREIIFENNLSEKKEINHIRVYHGTIPKFVNQIKREGLKDKTGYNQGWYMVSTDFESALFHANTTHEEKFAYVFEFDIPYEEYERWVGYPYLWKGGRINDNSTWFALMKPIPKEFIKKIHKIPYDKWLEQKDKKF